MGNTRHDLILKHKAKVDRLAHKKQTFSKSYDVVRNEQSANTQVLARLADQLEIAAGIQREAEATRLAERKQLSKIRAEREKLEDELHVLQHGGALVAYYIL